MSKQSAGILLYKKVSGVFRVLLVHPGGPFWAKKDAGTWSIPKGEFADGEEPFAAAKREFSEEIGSPAPSGDYIELGVAKQSSGKIVHAWAIEANFDATRVTSNTFTIEWPPKSGQQQEFPEVDRAAWFSIAKVKTKIVKGQLTLIEALVDRLGESADEPPEPQQTKLL